MYRNCIFKYLYHSFQTSIGKISVCRIDGKITIFVSARIFNLNMYNNLPNHCQILSYVVSTTWYNVKLNF